MATYTTNYNLEKPALSELYGIGVQNNNMDAIDTQMKQNADDIATLVNDLYYKVGDTIDLRNAIYSGVFTGANKSVIFYIPLNKPLAANVASATLTDVSVEVRHSDGGYLIATGHSLEEYGTVSTTIDTGRKGVLVQLTATTAWSTYTNNTPIAVRGYTTFKLTFS